MIEVSGLSTCGRRLVRPEGMGGRGILGLSPAQRDGAALFVQSGSSQRSRQGGGRSQSSPPRTCRHSYCLQVTLTRRLHGLAPGLSARSALAKLAAVQMIDVHLPTTDGREIILTRTTEPEPELRLLLDCMNLALPAQPPPRIAAARNTAAVDEIARLTWRAHAEGQLADATAQAVSEALQGLAAVELAEQHAENRIAAKFIVVVEVLIAERQAEDALRHQGLDQGRLFHFLPFRAKKTWFGCISCSCRPTAQLIVGGNHAS